MFEGDIILSNDIIFSNYGIFVKTSPNMTVHIFDLDPENHGFMYQKRSEFVAYARDKFKIIKELEF